MEEEEKRFRFGRKELFLFLAGTGLAVIGLGPEDPFFVVFGLLLSGAGFLLLCIFDDGKKVIRILVVIGVILGFPLIGRRLLRPKKNPDQAQAVPNPSHPHAQPLPAPSSLPHITPTIKPSSSHPVPTPKQREDHSAPVPLPTPQEVDDDLSMGIVNAQSPSLVFENSSDKVVEGLTWELVMFRTSDSATFSFATQDVGYVKPHAKTAQYAMSLATLPKAENGGKQITIGDSFLGSIAVDCPLCKGATYIVHFIWGQSGWFFKLPNDHGGLVLPKGTSSQAIEAYAATIESIANTEKKQEIAVQP